MGSQGLPYRLFPKCRIHGISGIGIITDDQAICISFGIFKIHRKRYFLRVQDHRHQTDYYEWGDLHIKEVIMDFCVRNID